MTEAACEDRDRRIANEVLVDCYDDYEISTCWYCYLDERLSFPFAAEWSGTEGSRSETVEVVGMADEDTCNTNILVEIKYRDGTLEDIFSIPLTEIRPLISDHQRVEAIRDWQYWIGQGNQLVDPEDHYYDEY